MPTSSHFSPASAQVLPWAAVNIHLHQHGILHGLEDGHLLWCGVMQENLFCGGTWSTSSASSCSHLSAHKLLLALFPIFFTARQCFCLSYTLSEAPPPCLLSSTVLCSGFIGTTCVSHRLGPASPHRDHPQHCSPTTTTASTLTPKHLC